MKMGFRTPSLSKSFKAMTTGRIKRSIKRTISPLYGKKNIGLITNPQKSIYNRVYKRTTIGIFDIIKKFFK